MDSGHHGRSFHVAASLCHVGALGLCLLQRNMHGPQHQRSQSQSLGDPSPFGLASERIGQLQLFLSVVGLIMRLVSSVCVSACVIKFCKPGSSQLIYGS